VELHPSGDFLYGSNRGHNSIVIYRVDKKTGRLTLLGHQPTEGDFPRGFAVAPTGEYLYAANQNTGDISAHFINQKSGELTFTGQLYDLPTPVFVGF
jgi:6-phosphogluconolactonase